MNQYPVDTDDLEKAYRDMAADADREREAQEWSEGLIRDACQVTDAQEWFKTRNPRN